MDTNAPKASFLIVNYRQKSELNKLVEYIIKNFKYSYEILIFNNSKEPLNFLSKNIKVFSVGQNIGFASAVDYLAIKAKYNYLYVLNPDLRIIKNLNISLKKFSSLPLPYGVFSLGKPDKCVNVPFFSKLFNQSKRYSSYSFIVYKKVFASIGGYNPHYFMYFEDEDFNLRLNKFKIKTFYPKTPYVHHLKTYTNENFLIRKCYYYNSFLFFLKQNNTPLYLLFFIPLKLFITICKIIKKGV